MPNEPAFYEILRRNGIEPTGDRKKDLELLKAIMPKGYKR